MAAVVGLHVDTAAQVSSLEPFYSVPLMCKLLLPVDSSCSGFVLSLLHTLQKSKPDPTPVTS